MTDVSARHNRNETVVPLLMSLVGAALLWGLIFFLVYAFIAADTFESPSVPVFLALLVLGATILSGFAISYWRDVKLASSPVQLKDYGFLAYGTRIEWENVKAILTDEEARYVLAVFGDISKDGSALKIMKDSIPSLQRFLEIAKSKGIEVIEDVPSIDSARRRLAQLGLDKNWQE